MGRRCADNILEHVDAAGGCFAPACLLAASMLDGQQKEAHVFLRHADGYRVPVLVRVSTSGMKMARSLVQWKYLAIIQNCSIPKNAWRK